ncbi:hypothetical protein PANO111632_21355 [Paracoccus nototheniae]|uniref:Uncharacterized protein n=1 Tax=Paracoccus nototheniae TaxID=2489002 RepID=A0ABW4DYJ2_9RHOB|nr:hypothetical protein [Paracoccus nototheniae]
MNWNKALAEAWTGQEGLAESKILLWDEEIRSSKALSDLVFAVLRKDRMV